MIPSGKYKPDVRIQPGLSDEEILRELRRAIQSGDTLVAYCKKAKDDGTLEIPLGKNIKGYIPREEVTYKVEKKDGLVHKGKSQKLVGLDVQFKVKEIKELNENGEIPVILSRKEAVEEIKERFIRDLKVGSIVKGVVFGLQSYGAFIDIGGDVSGVLGIKYIKRVFVSSPDEVFKVGDVIDVAVKSIIVNDDRTITIDFTRIDLLPGWDEVYKNYQNGDTIRGKIKTIIDTGIFVELDDSYEGLADFIPGRHFKYGEEVTVKIDDINPDKEKIKLRIVG